MRLKKTTLCAGLCAGVLLTACEADKLTIEDRRYQVRVTLAGDGAGDVRITPPGNDCFLGRVGHDICRLLPEGTTVTLTAEAAMHSRFNSFDPVCGTESPCTLTLDASFDVVAVFNAETYPLEVCTEGSGAGRVSFADGSLACDGASCTTEQGGGASRTLTAEPAAGSRFVGWSDICEGTEPCSVDMDGPRRICARFEAGAQRLTVTTSGEGIVRTVDGAIDCPGTCSASFAPGTEVRLVARPVLGSALESWTGCDQLGASTCTVMLDADTEVDARFQPHPADPTLLGVELDTLARPGGTGCWFSEMRRAVAHGDTGTIVAVGAHRYCSSQTDSITLFETTTDIEGFAATPIHDSSYGGRTQAEWAKGAPGSIAAAVDPQGGYHVAVPLREGARTWEPDRLLHVYRPAADDEWSATFEAVSAGQVQVDQSNRSGEPYAGFITIALGWPTNGDTLSFIANDSAWFARQYHVLEATSDSASYGVFSSPSLVTQVPGIIDRAAIEAVDQDWDRTGGAQAWVDKAACAVNIREARWGGNGWGAAETVPLMNTPCTTNADDHYGFFGDVAVLHRGGQTDVWALIRHRSDPNRPHTLYHLRRSGGAWTTTVTPVDWDKGLFVGYGAPRVFTVGAETYFLFASADKSQIGIYDARAGHETVIHTASAGAVIEQVDIAKHDPQMIVWTETEGTAGPERLYVAELPLLGR